MTFDIEDGILKAYENPDNETEVIIPDGVRLIDSLVFRDDEHITRVILPDSVEEIGWQAFAYCMALTEVVAGKGLREIGQQAFEHCSLLRKVLLQEGVKEIGFSAFSKSALEEINIPESVESIRDKAFYLTPWLECQTQDFVIVNSRILLKCNNMHSRLVIPDGVKSIYGNHMLSDGRCGYGDSRYESSYEVVTELVIPDSVEYIGAYVFAYGNLESVYIGDGVKHIAEGAFRNNKNLRTIRFPESLERVGHAAFRNTQWAMDNLDRVVMANSHLLLQGERRSETVVLPEGIREINDYAFSNAKMKHLICPASLRSIGASAFYNCRELEKVEFNEGLEAIGENIFGYCAIKKILALPSTLRRMHEYAIISPCRLDINFSTDRQLSDIIQISDKLRGLYICAPKIPVSQTGEYNIYASIGFMELMVNGGTVSPEIEKSYKEHIRKNAGEMIGLHIFHSWVFDYMCRERMIPLDRLDYFMEKYKGDTEVLAMLLECSRGNEDTDYDI